MHCLIIFLKLFVYKNIIHIVNTFKGNYIFNHVYACIKISYIANTMICYVLAIHKILTKGCCAADGAAPPLIRGLDPGYEKNH